VDGTDTRQLTRTPTGHSRAPFWSPDGRRAAFSSNRDGNEEVHVMDVDGSAVRNVTNHAAADIPNGWSADGEWLLFGSTRDRLGRDVYPMRPDGSGVTRLTTTR
jgi:TolB protein